jgi:hypothetical protein
MNINFLSGNEFQTGFGIGSKIDSVPLTSLAICHLKPLYLSHLSPDFTLNDNGAQYVSQEYLHIIGPFIHLQEDWKSN